jgi:CHAD domain-containing protein/CYTH domain-containing protein
MEPTESLLDLPAKTAVRWVCLGSLRKAERACERLLAGGDPAALHDLRVALRRLRSTIRAFRAVLDDTVTRGDRRRLRGLLDDTSAGRDLEVRTAWVERLLADDPSALARCEPLLRGLRDARDQELAALARRLDRRFPPACRRLEKHLSRYAVKVDGQAVHTVDTMRRALAPALARAAAELRDRLEALEAVADAASAHRARLAAKRLRYLLRPFERELVGAAELARGLGEMQTLLGDFRDLGAFEEELAALARPRREQARTELFERWLPAEKERLLGGVERLAEELAGPGADREIERKFLLNGLPDFPAGREPLEVEQGWFGVRLPERVRRVRGGAGERYYRAIKHGAGLVRLEIEEPIGVELFAALWPLTEGRRVRKRRYRVDVGDLCWEIDLFTDRDLVLAEVELPATDHPLEIPDWLRPCLVRDVTGEGAYVNLNLAR